MLEGCSQVLHTNIYKKNHEKPECFHFMPDFPPIFQKRNAHKIGQKNVV